MANIHPNRYEKSPDERNIYQMLEDANAKGRDLEKRLEKCCNSLREAINYLDDVADADMDDSGYVPNEEMRLLSSLRITLMEVTND